MIIVADHVRVNAYALQVGPVSATLPGGQRLAVTSAHVDEYAIRIRYTIDPTLPDRGPDGRPPVTWFFQAEDDLGNQYTDGGGAYGPSPDGERTDGVLSLQPLPADAARRLTVRVTPWDGPAIEPAVWLEFTVTLTPA